MTRERDRRDGSVTLFDVLHEPAATLSAGGWPQAIDVVARITRAWTEPAGSM